jgi:hypothetical protein
MRVERAADEVLRRAETETTAVGVQRHQRLGIDHLALDPLVDVFRIANRRFFWTSRWETIFVVEGRRLGNRPLLRIVRCEFVALFDELIQTVDELRIKTRRILRISECHITDSIPKVSPRVHNAGLFNVGIMRIAGWNFPRP